MKGRYFLWTPLHCSLPVYGKGHSFHPPVVHSVQVISMLWSLGEIWGQKEQRDFLKVGVGGRGQLAWGRGGVFSVP
jgi:hypothetical protein